MLRPVAICRGGHESAPQFGIPPHRISASVGKAGAGHHRFALRGCAEPGAVHRQRFHDQLVEAGNYLNAHFSGMALEQVGLRLKGEVENLRGEIATLMQAAIAAPARSTA